MQAGGRRFDPAWLHQTLATPTTTVHRKGCASVVRVSGRESRAMFFNNQENCILAFSDKREAIRSSYQFNLSHVAFVRPAPYAQPRCTSSGSRLAIVGQSDPSVRVVGSRCMTKRFFSSARRGLSGPGSVRSYVTAAHESCNEAIGKKIKSDRLFGVIWSSE